MFSPYYSVFHVELTIKDCSVIFLVIMCFISHSHVTEYQMKDGLSSHPAALSVAGAAIPQGPHQLIFTTGVPNELPRSVLVHILSDQP